MHVLRMTKDKIMKRLIIAMKDKHQSQKLAIVLSNSFDSIILNSPAKLRSYIMNDQEEFFSIIYEDSANNNFSLEVERLQQAKSIQNPVIKITSGDNTESSTDNRLILKKPFGAKELIKTTGSLLNLTDSSSIAIA